MSSISKTQTEIPDVLPFSTSQEYWEFVNVPVPVGYRQGVADDDL